METSTSALPTALQPKVAPTPAPAVSAQPATSPSPQQSQPTNQGQAPQQTITASDGTVLDAGVVNLSKAIRQQESGGNYNAVGDNGTSQGAYQWQPGNFAKDATQFGLNPNDFSPVNQDKVAYAQINAYKQAGYSPDQIASLWNSGKPDATGNVGVTEINGKPVNYDTPKYVQGVMNYFNQYKQQNPGQPATASTTPQASPSVGGFLGNVVKSGANFLGNTANAVLHPIQTVQNIGGAAVGALDEVGGQNNAQTAQFDNLKNYFTQRYGSVDNLLHTAYTDPVGLAADVSAALGVGGGLADVGASAADAAGLGAKAVQGAGEADFVAGANGIRSTASSGLAGGLETAGDVLGKGTELTNPLTPLVKGAGALLNGTKGFSDIIANPQNYSAENIANSTGQKIASDVQDAFDAKRADLSDTGTAYTPFKESPAQIQTTPDGLDNIIRDSLKVDITDGVIKPTSTSLLRDSTAISKLQSVYNTYKSDFLNGTMDSEKFLNLRSDLGNMAYNDLGVKNTAVASAAEDVRNTLNDTYRDQIPGLKDLDTEYSGKINKINELEDGMVYKTGSNKGEIKSSFLNNASKALKTGDTEKLAQLEEIIPGITKRLQVMKTMKDLESPSFVTSLVEKGGVAGGLLTGNLKDAAAAFSSIILQQPEIAVPLLRSVGASIGMVKSVMANLAKYATLSASVNNQQSMPQQSTSQQEQTVQPPVQGGSSPQETISGAQGNSSFDNQAALNAGYSQDEINQFLATQ